MMKQWNNKLRSLFPLVLPIFLVALIPDRGSGQDPQIALTATVVSSTEITLTWTGTDNAGHQIQWNTGATANWASATTINIAPADNFGIGTEVNYSHSHTSLTPSTTYHYRIRPTSPDHSAGPPWPTSGNSVTSATTQSAGATQLPTPTNFGGSTSANGVDLSWDSQTDVTFEIEWDTLAAASRTWKTNIPDQTGTTYSHTGLQAGALYSYRIKAASKTATTDTPSDWSTVANATAGGQLFPIVGFDARKISGTSISLTWSQHPYADSYRIEESSDEQNWTLLAEPLASDFTGQPDYLHQGLQAQRYYYRIAAVSNTSNVARSEWATANATTEQVAIAAITNFTATPVHATRIDLSWDQHPQQDLVTGLEINWGTGANDLTNTSTRPKTATSWEHRGRSQGITYHYRIRAHDDNNNVGPWTDVIQAVTRTTAALDSLAPRNLTAHPGQGAIELEWNVPLNNANLEHYVISVSTNGSTWDDGLATGVTGRSYTHTGLGDGVTRHYRVAAVHSVDNEDVRSRWTSTATATTRATRAPTAPRKLTVNQSPEGIALTWQPPADSGAAAVTGYRIEASTDGGANWSQLAQVGTDTTYTHLDPTPEVRFHYRVRAINEHGASNPSNVVNVRALRRVPTAPRELRARVVDRSVRLSWLAPSDSGTAAITSYRVEFATDRTTTWTVLSETSTELTYTHQDPPPGTTVRYRVFAINRHGHSPASAVVSLRTQAAPPSPPRGLSARAIGTAVHLAWGAPTEDGGAPVSGYRIEIEVLGGWNVLVHDTQTSGTTYIHSDVRPGATLRYRVFAINSGGVSASSNIAQVQVQAVPPGPPAAISAIATSHTQIRVAWSPPKDAGGAPVTGYRVESSEDGTFWLPLDANQSATSTTYLHSDLEPATKYYYRVFAINKAGNGPPSEIAFATTAADLPGAPTTLTATVRGATRIDLSWRAPKYVGGISITGYQIEVSFDGVTWEILVDDTDSDEITYPHLGLSPSTTYYYRVSAINEVGVGEPSSVVHAITDATLPDKPTNLEATARSDSEIVLKWLAPEYDGGAPINGYLIEVSTDAGLTWSVARDNTGSNVTSFVDAELTPATTYHYRVAAINRIGTGERSEYAYAKTLAVVPDSPRNLEAEVVSSTLVELRWQPPEYDGGAPVTAYLLEISGDGRDWETLAEVMNDTEFSDDGVIPGRKWHYRVSAINEIGTGPPSNVVVVITDDPVQRASRVSEAILPKFAATAVSSTLRAISARVDAASKGGIADRRVNMMGARDGRLESLASGSSVTEQYNGLSIWSSADLTGLSDGSSTIEWDGEVFSVHAGIDGMLREGVLVGLAGSRSAGGFDFTDHTSSRDIAGTYDANLISMSPYFAWVRSDVTVWASTGFGWGEMAVSDSLAGERSSNITTSFVAVGGSKEIHEGPLGEFAVRAEGWTAGVDLAGNVPAYLNSGVDLDHINSMSFRMRRARVMLDWTAFSRSYEEHHTELLFQGGARVDRNGVETAVGGAEFGGGVRFESPTFRALGEGRMFIPHDSGYREWGVHGLIELRSRHDQGFALKVSPSYGQASSGISGLWESGVAHHLTDELPGGRVNAIIEYKIPSFGAIPYWRVDLVEGQRQLYAGFSYRFLNRVGLKSEAARRDGKNGLSLRGLWRF